VIDTFNIGPISRQGFVLQAGEGVGPGDWHYHCHVIQHMQSGMMGTFRVIE
jgi:manganese oxidase